MIEVKLLGITPNAEKIMEEAGRTAYLSFDKKTDYPILKLKNDRDATKIIYTEKEKTFIEKKEKEKIEYSGESWEIVKRWENSAAKFIEMLINSGHHSVLEHSYASFRIRGGSRAFTHQIVRHRLSSFTQQSQRYVDEKDFEYIIPNSIENNKEAKRIFMDFMEKAKNTYHKLRELKVKREDARFVLPNATESEIVISANFREWRHIFELRGHPTAQWEIRKIIIEIYKILKKEAPSVFFDFIYDKEKETLVRKNKH
jgi:thymidylate synthase (FAD)